MNPFSPGQDVFQTQADQRFNSFSNPMNEVNQNPGSWGMDANYMTPSYTSPFRPRYSGPNGAGASGYKPGFFKSVNHTFNPFEGGGTNYGGSSYTQSQPYYDAIGMRPVDAGMGAMQSLVIPTAISMASFKFLKGPGERLGGGFGAGLMGSLTAGLGETASATFATAGRAVGGFAGSMAVPMIAAQIATKAFDKALFEPFIAQRNIADSIRRNSYGVSYGEGLGNAVIGGGMSRRSAAAQASQVSGMAAYDATFSQMEVSQISDYAGRSGLLDNSSGSQAGRRLKEITSQVKTVMAVANTSDFKEAIEIISKLQMSGVNPGKVHSTLGAIGGLASAAGMSTQRLMNTVGAQGQYLYGANGLTPYVGQMTAGAAAASFGSAYRSGLMSPALMARMGGVEGASQSANAGLLAALQSPYSTVIGMNSMHGGSPGSIVGNMSMFGGHVSGNPAENIGMMNLMSPSLTSHMAETQGVNQVNRMLRQIASMSPGMMKNGKVGAGSAYSILTGAMGIGDSEARALMEQMRAYSDPNSVKGMNAGLDRSEMDFMLKFADQNSMNKGIFTRPYNAVAHGFKEVGFRGQRIAGRVSRFGAGISDDLEEFMYGSMYGIGNANGSINGSSFDAPARQSLEINMGKANKVMSGMGISDKYTLNDNLLLGLSVPGMAPIMALGISTGIGSLKSEVSAINKSVKAGDSDAQGLLNATSKNERLKYIKKLADKGVLSDNYKDEAKASSLAATLESSGTIKTTDQLTSVEGRMDEAYQKATGANSVIVGGEILSLTSKLTKNADDDVSMKRLSTLLYGDSEKINAINLEGELSKIEIGSATYGTRNGGDVYDAISRKSKMDSVQIRNKARTKGGIEELNKILGTTGAKNLEQIYAKFGDSMNRNIVEKGLDPSKTGAITHDAAIAFNQTMQGISDEKAKLRQLASDGAIDFSQYTSSVNALDNKETITKFGSAVDRFGIYVEAVVTGKSVASVTKSMDDASGKISAG